ncbi:MAG: hypothetical protein A3H69_02630 [Candidatus Sungbacteria bacterium RIFCSPLOWO2_02_FULL_47_9]|nr:MAG: hypothetical protein A3H69_02630 [Candidatus Sungbacteria bacterium RIFCSPLOWO2_02_FULL_47_9]
MEASELSSVESEAIRIVRATRFPRQRVGLFLLKSYVGKIDILEIKERVSEIYGENKIVRGNP